MIGTLPTTLDSSSHICIVIALESPIRLVGSPIRRDFPVLYTMIRSAPPISAHLAMIPALLPAPRIGWPAAMTRRSRDRISLRAMRWAMTPRFHPYQLGVDLHQQV